MLYKNTGNKRDKDNGNIIVATMFINASIKPDEPDYNGM